MTHREKKALKSERDRRLLGWLARCGVLSVEQMSRIPGFLDCDRSVVTRRLRKLSGALWGDDLRLVERVHHNADVLMDWHAWKLTPRGHEIVAIDMEPKPRFMDVPPGPGVVQHHFEAADLPLRIAERLRVRDVRRLPFSWTYERTFNFVEVHRPTGLRDEKTLSIDGVLVIPAAKRIFLVEWESGSQSIESSDWRNTGATTKRIARYSSFFTESFDRGAPPAVNVAFKEGWPVEVLFLFPDGNRARRVKEVVAANHPKLPFQLHIQTCEDAADQIAKVIVDAGVPLGDGEDYRPRVAARRDAAPSPEIIWSYAGGGSADGPLIALSLDAADKLQQYLRHATGSYGSNRHPCHEAMVGLRDGLWSAIATQLAVGAKDAH